MEYKNFIPEFQRKELNPKYLSETYEDDVRWRFKILWTSIDEYGFSLSISEILKLMEYQNKANLYANELISLLSGKPFRYYLSSQMERFREEFHPESESEKLIFNIFKAVCDELIWIDDILLMQNKDKS